MTAAQHQPGTLYRAPMKFESSFTQLPNTWLRDQRMSRGARGLLGELMTHAVGFSVSIAGLVERGTEGRDAVRRMIAELEGCGYLRRDKQSRKGGHFAAARWTLMDPWDALVTPSPSSDFPTSVNPTSDFPTSDAPSSVEPTLRTPTSKTYINGDFPAQPSVVSAEPVDNSGKAACGRHDVIPGTDRCAVACSRDFEIRSGS